MHRKEADKACYEKDLKFKSINLRSNLFKPGTLWCVYRLVSPKGLITQYALSLELEVFQNIGWILSGAELIYFTK